MTEKRMYSGVFIERGSRATLVVDILCTVTRVMCGDRYLIVSNRQAASVGVVVIVVAGWGDGKFGTLRTIAGLLHDWYTWSQGMM